MKRFYFEVAAFLLIAIWVFAVVADWLVLSGPVP
jgi:hypothetical protein